MSETGYTERRATYGAEYVPGDPYVATVRRQSAYITISDETLVDCGLEPSPGYWQRELERSIRSANFRYRHPVAWARVVVVRRINDGRARLGRRIFPNDRNWDE